MKQTFKTREEFNKFFDESNILDALDNGLKMTIDITLGLNRK